MGNMRFKVGDRVRIKSLDWYNKNKDDYGYVWCTEFLFTPEHSKYCGRELIISHVTEFEIPSYVMESNGHDWTNEMIEGLVEEETLIERVDDNGLPFNEWLSHKGAFYIPDGYELKDENGNVINATKIVLEKKKKEYPKTYCECKDILGLWDIDDTERGYYKTDLIDKLQMLLICRDAYWKLYGEEMGLGKPWEPDWNTSDPKYVIACTNNGIEKQWETTYCKGFAFPTEEMRDAFYEVFREEIEICKELL